MEKDSRYYILRDHFARDYRIKPTCPFCGLDIERPKEQTIHKPTEMPVGSCSCGAVYAFDVTGHNLGAAFLEALVFSCNMDWDLAFSLQPEQDYREELVQNYDAESNLIIPVGAYEGRRVAGALYFIRLHQEIQQVTKQPVQQKINQFKPIAARTGSNKPRGKKDFTKKQVQDWVKNYQLKPLLAVAEQDDRIIHDLQRLLYAADELTRLRTADILGQVTGIIAQQNPSVVAKLLQRLFTSVTNADYGSSNWGAIDAIGAIVNNSPVLYGGYIASLYQFLGDPQLRPRTLNALALIAQTNPQLIQKSITFFTPFLSDQNSAVRGYTTWLLGHLNLSPLGIGVAETKAILDTMTDDGHLIDVYNQGQLQPINLGQLAQQTLVKINAAPHCSSPQQ